jgi:hypothetical protein
MNKDTKILMLRISEKDHEEFKRLLKENGCTMNGMLRKFIRDYIKLYQVDKKILQQYPPDVITKEGMSE